MPSTRENRRFSKWKKGMDDSSTGRRSRRSQRRSGALVFAAVGEKRFSPSGVDARRPQKPGFMRGSSATTGVGHSSHGLLEARRSPRATVAIGRGVRAVQEGFKSGQYPGTIGFHRDSPQVPGGVLTPSSPVLTFSSSIPQRRPRPAQVAGGCRGRFLHPRSSGGMASFPPVSRGLGPLEGVGSGR